MGSGAPPGDDGHEAPSQILNVAFGRAARMMPLAAIDPSEGSAHGRAAHGCGAATSSPLGERVHRREWRLARRELSTPSTHRPRFGPGVGSLRPASRAAGTGPRRAYLRTGADARAPEPAVGLVTCAALGVRRDFDPDPDRDRDAGHANSNGDADTDPHADHDRDASDTHTDRDVTSSSHADTDSHSDEDADPANIDVESECQCQQQHQHR
jgi:hypothetical protein